MKGGSHGQGNSPTHFGESSSRDANPGDDQSPASVAALASSVVASTCGTIKIDKPGRISRRDVTHLSGLLDA